MVKPLLLVAIAAHIFVLASSTKRYRRNNQHNVKAHWEVFVCRKDEMWVSCPEAVCAPQTCADVGFDIPCFDLNRNGTCPSKPRCICKEGFVRCQKGHCIPIESCPSCGGDPNAQSGCGTNCWRCSNYFKKNVFCTEQCYYNACDCKKGFVFDEIRNKCVRPKECHAPVKCKRKNEVYDPCPSSCPPRTCGINDAAVSCAPALPFGHRKCPKPICRCRDGFYRNHLGKCVRWDQCPTCKRPNEIYDPCPAPCPPRTCNVNEALILCQTPPQLGDPECKPACRCVDGFVRNQTGICIPKDDCPRCTKPNQVYDPCIAPCPPRRCGVDKRLIRCAAPPKLGDPSCEAGCRCADGYVTNSEGVCIPEEECPIPCNGDPNAVSGCGTYCNQRCRDIGKKPGPCILICRDNACDCLQGYYLDENTGRCVLPKQCTPQCSFNEVYSDCVQGSCRPQNCSQVGNPVPCAKINPKYCKKGCLCKEGYARNHKGVCVPVSECPSCGGDRNKVPGCGVYCNQRCGDIGTEPKFCIAICYENACDCRKGYYLDGNTGLCVLPEDCTPQCPINEWYSECTQGNCSPQKCSEVESPLPCPRIDPKYCNKGCLCNEGYVRNDKGVCIPISDCGSSSCQGDRNKVPGCGVYCNQRCGDIGTEPKFCIDICYENACDCRKGYYLDESTGFCVLPEDCTPQCPKNELYSDCTQGNCRAENCTQVGFPIACPSIDPAYCKKGCLCNEGYARNHKGICIPSNQCPSCGGDKNAQSGCGGNCNRHCSDIGKEPRACTLICELNGCNCKDGFYYDDRTKKCVKPEECKDLTPNCGKNEEYNTCANAHCGPQTCDDLGYPVSCENVEPEDCTKECRCKPGFVRNYKGICIPSNQCPSCGGDPNAKPGCGGNCNKRCSNVGKKPGVCALSCILNGCDCKDGYYYDENTKRCVKPGDCSPTCPLNEVYSECTNGGCQARNCSQYGKPVPCIKIDPKYCKKGCVCKENYLRASNGQCVPQEDCKVSCGGDPNAVPGCGVNCGRHCSDLDKTEPVACPDICQRDGCDCKEGYYYDDDTQRCVKPEDCAPECPLNERYDSCPGSSCDPQYCEDLGFSDSDSCTPQSDEESCSTEPGCVCVDGYVRDKDDKCIPKNECPSCGDDPNARSGCGVNCGKRCRDLVQPGPCLKICYPNACDCVDGFYFDSNQKKCVPADECTDVCGKNEVFEDCSNPTCKAKSCSQVGLPLDCNKKCVKGCVCQNGYVRNGKGICIPIKECPSCGGDPNAQSGCGTNCGRRCPNNYINPKFCPRIACVPQLNKCDCKNGFFYDINTKCCVKLEECSPRCDYSNNEVYDSCVNGGCGWRNCSQVGGPKLCIDPIKCNKGCKCKEGYYRLDNGTCVPEDKCPSSSCGDDPNAQPGCGFNCGKRCPNNYINPKLCPRIECKPTECDCKDGYYYDINTKSCVELEDCSPRCDESKNEVYDSCVNGGCGWRNCSQVGGPQICIRPKKCNKGCKCIEGYYRLDNGSCVPEDECPSSPQCPLNERYDSCPGSSCDPQYCEDLGFSVSDSCTPQSDEESCSTEPGCVCVDGYVRDKDDKCIPKNECPSCGDDPNARSGCGVNCGKRCRDLVQPGPCLKICYPNACDCVDGFYFDSNQNKCVPADECTDVCGKNEVFEDCSNPTCKAKSCSQVGLPLDCNKKCVKGCVCQNGYVRNGKGICIPIKECPSCGGDPNAQSGCGTNCGRRCPNNYINPKFCPRIACVPQLNKCDCKNGFFYDINTKCCVKLEECSPRCDYSNNEVYDSCVNGGCGWRNCSQVGGPKLCIDPIKCNKGCKCKEGYYRLDNGTCVPEDKCPSSSCGDDPNAQPGCGFNCGKRCPNNYINPKLCPRIECKPTECDCKDGYYYDINTKSCVELEDCSPRCDESKNEVYDSCVNGGCGWRNCSQVGGPQICIRPKKCNKGCKCIEGYYRLDNGTCVPEDECPSSSCGDDPNAQPGCGYNCGKRCPNNYINPKLCPKIECNPTKCDCKDGYYYDNNTKSCVKLEDCSPRCDYSNNEVYDSCVNGGCGWRNCSQVGGPKLCIDPIKCNKGCKCIEGYYRLDNGTCVPEDECPYSSCGDDPNAQPGCGYNCEKRCPNNYINPKLCPGIQCKPDKCDCKDGYYYDINTRNCVEFEDCSPRCNAQNYEVYDPCPPRCPPQTCESLDKKRIYNCPNFNATVCEGQCRCKPNFYKNKIGQCICKEDCLKCMGPNEYFSCGPVCDNVCGSAENKTNCKTQNIKCTPKCYCEDGYARNEKGICIPIDQCPKSSC